MNSPPSSGANRMMYDNRSTGGYEDHSYRQFDDGPSSHTPMNLSDSNEPSHSSSDDYWKQQPQLPSSGYSKDGYDSRHHPLSSRQQSLYHDQQERTYGSEGGDSRRPYCDMPSNGAPSDLEARNYDDRELSLRPPGGGAYEQEENRRSAERRKCYEDQWNSTSAGGGDNRRPTNDFGRRHFDDHRRPSSDDQQRRPPFDDQRRGLFDGQKKSSYEDQHYSKNCNDQRRSMDDQQRSIDDHSRIIEEKPSSYDSRRSAVDSNEYNQLPDKNIDYRHHEESYGEKNKEDSNNKYSDQFHDYRMEQQYNMNTIEHSDKEKKIPLLQTKETPVVREWPTDEKKSSKRDEEVVMNRKDMDEKDNKYEMESASWADVSNECDYSTSAFQPHKPKGDSAERDEQLQDKIKLDGVKSDKVPIVPSPITKERLEACDKEKEIRKNMTTLKKGNQVDQSEKTDSKENAGQKEKQQHSAKDRSNAWVNNNNASNNSNNRSSKNGERTRPDSVTTTNSGSHNNNNSSNKSSILSQGGETTTAATSWAEKTAGLTGNNNTQQPHHTTTAATTTTSNSKGNKGSTNTRNNNKGRDHHQQTSAGNSRNTTTTTNNNNSSSTAQPNSNNKPQPLLSLNTTATNKEHNSNAPKWSRPLLETPILTPSNNATEVTTTSSSKGKGNNNNNNRREITDETSRQQINTTNINNNSVAEQGSSATVEDEVAKDSSGSGPKMADYDGRGGGSRSGYGTNMRGRGRGGNSRDSSGGVRGGYVNNSRGGGRGGGGVGYSTYRGGRAKYTEYSRGGRGSGGPPRMKKMSAPQMYDDYYYDSYSGYYSQQHYRGHKDRKVMCYDFIYLRDVQPYILVLYILTTIVKRNMLLLIGMQILCFAKIRRTVS